MRSKVGPVEYTAAGQAECLSAWHAAAPRLGVNHPRLHQDRCLFKYARGSREGHKRASCLRSRMACR